MKMQAQKVVMPIVVLAIMGLAGCGHYNCSSGANFGSSGCTSSGGGLGGGGNGNATTTAFAFHVDEGNGVGSTSGFIDGYTLNETNNLFTTTLNFVPPQIPFNQGSIGMVVGQKQFIYAVFDDLQAIYGWSVDGTTGFLTPLTGFPMTVALNIPSVTYNQYLVITNPAGNLLFISNPLNSQILVFQIGTSGSLTPAPGSPFTVPSGFIPQNLGMDGKGNFLYASAESTNHTSSSVMAFSVSGAGVLQPVQSTPFPFPMWQTQGDPSGLYLIGVSGRTVAFSGVDDDSVYVFNIASNGAITPVTNSPFSTAFPPQNMAVQPTTNASGTLIYTFGHVDVFNVSPNPTEGFQLNSVGQISEVQGSPFTTINSPLYAQFDQSGNRIFFYTFQASSQLSGLTDFKVASAGALTLGPAVTLSTNGYFTVIDEQ
jgi:6-phosphogluconolactonase (cycloisomerase 2 family)